MHFTVKYRMWGVALLAATLFAGTASAVTVDVNITGVKVGELTVNQTNLSGAVSVSDNITGNFLAVNQGAGGQGLLNSRAPLGLTFMQTVAVNTNLQQLIFRPSDYTPANGFVLAGTWSDPPIDGYVLYDGTTQLNPDPRPYYSTITPSGVAGDIPPISFAGGNQFRDTPTIAWANYNASTYGMANLLNGLNGSLAFETALVGACQEPGAAQARTGHYKVCVLEDFTWGLNFTYVGPGGGRGAGNYTAADYTTALIPLAFSTNVSATFRGAFDRVGNNAPVEWDVAFVQADDCPEPGTMVLMAIAAAALALTRRVRALV